MPELPLADVSVAFEIGKRDASRVPETIQVTYKNESSAKGAFELPGPNLEPSSEVYSTRWIAVTTEAKEDLSLSAIWGGAFARMPSKAKWSRRASMAILAPAESVTVEYSLEEFGMMMHATRANLTANFRACYRAGKHETKMQVIVVDGDDVETKKTSHTLLANLSPPDFSMHPDLDELAKPEAWQRAQGEIEKKAE
ncbi:MAG TPA: hypothetical protein VGJ26_01595 [Pirellulales bacterium]